MPVLIHYEAHSQLPVRYTRSRLQQCWRHPQPSGSGYTGWVDPGRTLTRQSNLHIALLTLARLWTFFVYCLANQVVLLDNGQKLLDQALERVGFEQGLSICALDDRPTHAGDGPSISGIV